MRMRRHGSRDRHLSVPRFSHFRLCVPFIFILIIRLRTVSISRP